MIKRYGGHSVNRLNAHLESIKAGLSKGGGSKLAKLNKIRIHKGLSTLGQNPSK